MALHEKANVKVKHVSLTREGDGRVLQALGLVLSHNHPKVRACQSQCMHANAVSCTSVQAYCTASTCYLSSGQTYFSSLWIYLPLDWRSVFPSQAPHIALHEVIFFSHAVETICWCMHAQGVKVSSVIPGSPAALHDPPIKVGDVLIDVNGTYVLDKSYFDTTTEVATAGAAAGAVVTFSLASAKAFKAVHGGDDSSDSEDDSDDNDDDDDDDDGSANNGGENTSMSSAVDATSPERSPEGSPTRDLSDRSAGLDHDEAHAIAIRTPPPAAFFDTAGVDNTAAQIEDGLAALVRMGAASPGKGTRAASREGDYERVCRIARPKLGGIGLEIAPAGIPPGSQFGARVARVKPGGPAEAAGVRLNDLILGVNGRAVGSFSLSQVGLEIGAAGSDVVLTVVAIDAVESGQYVLHTLTFDSMLARTFCVSLW